MLPGVTFARELEPIMLSEHFRQSLLSYPATIQQAVECIDQAGVQIAVVVDARQRLIGTVTDGDVRRGLLRGLTLASSADEIIQRDPFVLPASMDRQAVVGLMQANRIHQIPVVDEDRRVIGLHVLDELTQPVRQPGRMVIMAGGKGTRLRPYTESCPKPMLPVAGRPMLEHIIEHARADGFERFTISLFYLGEMIREHFGDGSRWNVAIDYVEESTPLGTGGALSLLDPPPDAPFIVTNGDVLTDVRYSDILAYHQSHGAEATMAVRSHEWQHPFGVVHTDGVEIAGFDEKPVLRTHINAGIYVLGPAALTHLESCEHCDMPRLFERLQASHMRTIVYPMHEPWLDVGRPDDLERARSERSA